MLPQTVGRVVIPDENYVQMIDNISSDEHDWSQDYSSSNITVWSRLVENSQVKVFKVHCTFDNVPASVLFDTIMDSDYRSVWDKNMIEGFDICYVNDNCDINYYALSSFPGIQNRDFALRRSWICDSTKYYVGSHSIFHKKIPVRPNFIRALTYLTAYVITPTGPRSCQLIYISHCDPRGKLPVWVINKATQYVAPMVIKRLEKACLNYEAWKSKNQPNFKPWLHPEQRRIDSINWDDVEGLQDCVSAVDESLVTCTCDEPDDMVIRSPDKRSPILTKVASST